MTSGPILTAIPRDAEVAGVYVEAGIDRIMVDLEYHGKADRQRGRGAHISSHTLADVGRFRDFVHERSDLMVRVNPMGVESPNEVGQAISAGADRLMLPMFESDREVCELKTIVDGEVPITFLAETPDAIFTAGSWLPLLDGDDDVHVGLNDLSIALGYAFLFEVLTDGILDEFGAMVKARDRTFGIGGVGRHGRSPVDAHLIIGEHVRLGSQAAILSRAFFDSPSEFDVEGLSDQIKLVHDSWARWNKASPEELLENSAELDAAVRTCAEALR